MSQKRQPSVGPLPEGLQSHSRRDKFIHVIPLGVVEARWEESCREGPHTNSSNSEGERMGMGRVPIDSALAKEGRKEEEDHPRDGMGNNKEDGDGEWGGERAKSGANF